MTTPVTTPRVSITSPRERGVQSSFVSQPLLTTGSIPSEVSHLFRTKRVSDIRQFEAHIRNEAEEKSESLRQLLGTRYRDLLKAADQITNMCDTAAVSVCDALHTVSKTSVQLRNELNDRARSSGDHKLSGEKSSSESTSATSDADLARRRAVHDVGFRLKHIVDSPEILYAYLEEDELYEAASRFVTTERNFRDLVDSPTDDAAVASRFAHARWRLVSPFRGQILATAERRLVTPGLDVNAYARIFAAIVLLSEHCDVVSVVETILATRTTWLGDRQTDSESTTGSTIRDVASVVRETVSCMAHLFWRHPEDGVEALVQAIDPSSAELVSAARDRGGLNGVVVAWTTSVREWLNSHGNTLLASASNSREVAEALHSIDTVFSEPEWHADCDAALHQPTEFVFDIFKPFISDRAAIVAKNCVESVVQRVLTDIATAWSEIDGSSDVSKFIWSTISSQAVGLKSLKQKSDNCGNKFQGFNEETDVAQLLSQSGPIALIIQRFEQSLSEVLNDVTSLAQRVPVVYGSFDSSIKRNMPLILDDLQDRVASVNYDETEQAEALSSESNEHRMEQCLFVARMASAIRAVKSVTLAYSCAGGNMENYSNEDGITALKELQNHADKVASMGYHVWAGILCDSFSTDLSKELLSEKCLHVEMGWSNSFEPNISMASEPLVENSTRLRFPTTVSTGVVNYLLHVCNGVSRAGGFALPVEAIEYTREAVARIVVRVLRETMKKYIADVDGARAFENIERMEHQVHSMDTAWIQMLFDVQCIRALTENKTTESVRLVPGDKSGLKQLENEIQVRIGSVDLASCRKALQESVNHYILKTSTLLGPLARRRDGAIAWAGSVRVGTNVSAAANLVCMSQPVARFTYLPAPMPSTYSSTGMGTAGLNAKAAFGVLRNESVPSNTTTSRKRETLDTSVAGYASKVSESVGRFGRGFFESLTRKVA